MTSRKSQFLLVSKSDLSGKYPEELAYALRLLSMALCCKWYNCFVQFSCSWCSSAKPVDGSLFARHIVPVRVPQGFLAIAHRYSRHPRVQTWGDHIQFSYVALEFECVCVCFLYDSERKYIEKWRFPVCTFFLKYVSSIRVLISIWKNTCSCGRPYPRFSGIPPLKNICILKSDIQKLDVFLILLQKL